MKSFVFGLAEFSRITGSMESYTHLPVGEISGHTVPAFLESAAEHGWELCATMPGVSRMGANVAQPDGTTRKVEDYNEVTTFIFKKETGGMTKQQKFLWIVQTAILANGTNLASQPEMAEKYRVEISASGALMTTDEAIRVSEMIPAEMSAFDAAHEFCTYMLLNQRDIEVKAKGSNYEAPYWLSRRLAKCALLMVMLLACGHAKQAFQAYLGGLGRLSGRTEDQPRCFVKSYLPLISIS